MTAKKNIISFLVIGILGTLGHFIYEWSGKIYALGLFFPVNESTWEHLKLLFFPAIIYFTVEFFTMEEKPKNYIPSSVISIFVGMAAIVVLFYTYRGVVGKNIDFINIAIYFIGVIITLITRQLLIKSDRFDSVFANIMSVSLLLIMGVLFAVFSFNPPELGIFMPPMLNS